MAGGGLREAAVLGRVPLAAQEAPHQVRPQPDQDQKDADIRVHAQGCHSVR